MLNGTSRLANALLEYSSNIRVRTVHKLTLSKGFYVEVLFVVCFVKCHGSVVESLFNANTGCHLVYAWNRRFQI